MNHLGKEVEDKHMREGNAYFVLYPRRINDLQKPHHLEAEKHYHIVDEIRLSCIDYENFSEDLLADRAFLDHYQGPHTKDGALQCILVRYWNQTDGVLVVPQNGFILYAARYIP